MGKQAKLKQHRRDVQRAVIELFVETAIPVFQEAFAPDCCLNGTRVAMEVLGRMGVPVRPMVTHATVMNEAWWKLLQAKDDWPNEIEMREWVDKHGAWALGVDDRPNEMPGYAGHLVLLAQERLVDTAAGQFARPAKSIEVPPMITAALNPGFVEGKKALILSEKRNKGTIVTYMAKPNDKTYETTPGFQPHHGNLRVAKRIFELMRERVGASPSS